MIQLKNTTDKQTFYIPKTTMETEFVSGYEAKEVSIDRNGTYQINPGSGKKALSAVKLDVDVKLEGQDKEVTYKDNGSYTIRADEGYPSLNTVEVEVNVDTDTYFDRGYAIGVKEQRAKLGTINITENGAYYKADGYKEINVNVPEVTFNTQNKEVTYTDNGEYTVTPDEEYDGIKEVKVTVDIDISNAPFKVPTDVKFAYSQFSKIPETWDWSDFENATDGSQLFMNCPNLIEAPKIPFKNVTDLSQIFYGCYDLKSIDTSEWDTSKLRVLSNAFGGTLIEENPQIDTSNVTNINYAFANCEELRKVTNLNTSKATSMQYIFDNCTMLNTVDELDASSIKSNFYSNNSPFYGCMGLRNFGGFKGLKVSMYMNQCHSLSYDSLINILNNLSTGVSGKMLYLTNDLVNMLSDDDIAIATSKGWNISPAKVATNPIVVTSLDDVSYNAYRITPINYDFSLYSDQWGDGAYTYLPNMDNLCVFEGDVSSTTNAKMMFCGCYNLRVLNLTNTGSITDMSHMLSECEKLYEANLKDWNVSNVTTMKGMFYNTGNLDADFSTWDVSNVTNFDDMFYKTRIKTVDMSTWKHNGNVRMKNMFANSYVEEIIFGDTTDVYMMDSIFVGARVLKSITMTYPVTGLLSNYSMFSNVTTEGTFYYNPEYDYSSIIKQLPATWKAVPLS